MTSVTYDPSEVYEVFQDEKEAIAKQRIEVAKSNSYAVYLDCMVSMSGGYTGMLVVESDGYVIEEDFFENEKECNDIFEKAFINYIFTEETTVIDKEDVNSFYDKYGNLDTYYADEIEQREGDLDLAVVNFIDEVSETCVSSALTEEQIGEIKDHFLEYLYRKFGLSVYRPMEIVMDNGSEIYEEYPYPKLRFEDPRGLYTKTYKIFSE